MQHKDHFDPDNMNLNPTPAVPSYTSDLFDYDAFKELFPDNQPADYEFEPENTGVYIPPAEDFFQSDSLDIPTEVPFTQEAASEPKAEKSDVMSGTGIYRTDDGTSEFCSFEDSVPAALTEGWHFEALPVPSSPQDSQDAYQVYDASDADYSETPVPTDQEVDDEDSEDNEDDLDNTTGRKHPVLHILGNMLLGFVTLISVLYLVAVYSDNVVVTKARNMYIQTAMSTLNHKWLATAIIPPDIIRDLVRLNYEAESSMFGVQSNWGDVVVQSLPQFENATTELTGTFPDAEENTQESNSFGTLAEEETILEDLYDSRDEQTFFELFYEVDYNSMQEYVEKHPEVIQNGWANININEAGLNDSGTEIMTIHGDQVLAINAKQGVILIRLNINLSRGVIAICKDTSRLSLCAASTLGSTGQTVGRICANNGGILAVTASAFVDPNGAGNGGEISGLAVCDGTSYGYSLGGGYKRLELRDDNHMYIVDSSSPLTAGTTNAAEFTPALIIDGQIVVDENSGWTSPNPRVCIGQTNYLETVMVAVEGRLTDSPGCSVIPIAEKMKQYGCVQAMNMDGGTSAMMYYDGQSIIRCSNINLANGRTVPTAWVYRKAN